MLEQSQQTNVNPVKCMWEAEGIKFPGRGILPNSSNTPTSTSCTTTLGAESVLYTDVAMAMALEEAKMYLELGINESLKSSPSTVKHVQESAITDTSSSEPDLSEPDYGLLLLFTIAKLVGD